MNSASSYVTSEWKGMDPRGRMMSHSPLNEDDTGQPAFIILEVINAYTDAGGSLERLIELLNSHIPCPSLRLRIDELLEEERFYSLEFYFYLCQFCKIVLNDPEFRFKGDEEQLSAYHYITEKGMIYFSPWYADGVKRDGYLSISNIRAMFIYIEEVFDTEEGKLPEGRKITDDVLNFINQCVEERYRITRSFFEKDAILISFEYLFYISSLLEYLTNKKDFYSQAFRYGFLYNNRMAEAVFLQPGTSPESGLKEWLQRTNSVYMLEIVEKRNSFMITADISRQTRTGMFERYEKNCIRGIHMAVPAVWSAFAEMATGRDVQYKVTTPEDYPHSFHVSIRWNDRTGALMLLSGSLISAVVTAAALYTLPSSGPLPLFASLLAGAVYLLGSLEHRRLKQTEKRYIKTGQTIKRQIDALQSVTGELLKERDSLEGTVKTRTAELEEALEQLKALDRGKTNFIANVSHELRTPLTLLTVPVEEIRKGRYGPSLSPEDRVFSLMERNISRLRRQINQLLDFTRLDMGEQPCHPMAVDLLGYCRGLVAELKSLVESKGLTLKLINRTERKKATVEADPILLESLMLNLLNNAVKFTDKGGVSLILEEDEADAERLHLTVKDTGIGFSEAESERIFERFSQGEENRDRRYEGTGLGLALVREVVRIQGWNIEAHGLPGKGASFRLTLPLCGSTPVGNLPAGEDRKERAWAGLSSTEMPESFMDGEGEAILLVEDSPDMAALLQDLLKKEYKLIWSHSGADALQRYDSEGPFSLVICDMMMPGMDGLVFREEFLKKTDDRELPFVYLTALADSDVRRKALASGALDYISKPFSGDELRLKIRNLLESRRLRYRQALRDSAGSERLIRISELEYREAQARQLEKFSISAAEQRVLELLKMGLQDKEIAEKLTISPRTVSTHLRNLYRKTGSQNRVELLNRIHS